MLGKAPADEHGFHITDERGFEETVFLPSSIHPVKKYCCSNPCLSVLRSPCSSVAFSCISVSLSFAASVRQKPSDSAGENLGLLGAIIHGHAMIGVAAQK